MHTGTPTGGLLDTSPIAGGATPPVVQPAVPPVATPAIPSVDTTEALQLLNGNDFDEYLYDYATGQPKIAEPFANKNQFDIFTLLYSSFQKNVSELERDISTLKKTKGIVEGKLQPIKNKLQTGQPLQHEESETKANCERQLLDYDSRINESEEKLNKNKELLDKSKKVMILIGKEKKMHMGLERVRKKQEEDECVKSEKDLQDHESKMSPDEHKTRVDSIINNLLNKTPVKLNEFVLALQDKKKYSFFSSCNSALMDAIRKHGIIFFTNGDDIVGLSKKDTDPIGTIDKIKFSRDNNNSVIDIANRQLSNKLPFLLNIVGTAAGGSQLGFTKTMELVKEKLDAVKREQQPDISNNQITCIVPNMTSSFLGIRQLPTSSDTKKRANRAQSVINAFVNKILAGKSREQKGKLIVEYLGSDLNTGAIGHMAKSFLKNTSDTSINKITVMSPGKFMGWNTKDDFLKTVKEFSEEEAKRVGGIDIKYEPTKTVIDKFISPEESDKFYEDVKKLDKVPVSIEKKTSAGTEKKDCVPSRIVYQNTLPIRSLSSSVNLTNRSKVTIPKVTHTAIKRPVYEIYPVRRPENNNVDDNIGLDKQGKSMEEEEIENSRFFKENDTTSERKPEFSILSFIILFLISFGILALVYYVNWKNKCEEARFKKNNSAVLGLSSRLQSINQELS